MSENQLAGEHRDRNVAGGRTVVVGVKLDSQSRELLTWSLVKQAQPGDHVVALHILTNNGNPFYSLRPNIIFHVSILVCALLKSTDLKTFKW